MPPESMIPYITNREWAGDISASLILQGAPVLKGEKAGCLFTVKAGSSGKICAALYGTGVSMCRLYHKNNNDLIFLYRDDLLEQYLSKPCNRKFLDRFGYQGKTLRGDLTCLAKRIAFYHSRNNEFPHEMGLFLEYPLADVIGFMEHGGDDYLYLGYWKVYGDVEAAKQTFQRYDRAREVSLRELLSGKNIREIAC